MGIKPVEYLIKTFYYYTMCVTVTKLGKDLAPICFVDVVWIERRVTNNVNKTLELRLRFLKTAIPVPVPQ